MRIGFCILVLSQIAAAQEAGTTLIGLISEQEAVAYRLEEHGYVIQLMSDHTLSKVNEYFANLEDNVRKKELLEKRWNELREQELQRLSTERQQEPVPENESHLDEIPPVPMLGMRPLFEAMGVGGGIVPTVKGGRRTVLEFDDKDRARMIEALEMSGMGGRGAAHLLNSGSSKRRLQQFETEDPEMQKLRKMIASVSQPLEGFTIAEVSRSGSDFIGLRDMETKKEILIPLHRIAHVGNRMTVPNG